jgi:hypothetical protein
MNEVATVHQRQIRTERHLTFAAADERSSVRVGCAEGVL